MKWNIFLVLITFVFISYSMEEAKINDIKLVELSGDLEARIQSLTVKYKLSIKENFEKYISEQILIIINRGQYSDFIKSLIAIKLGELIKVYYSEEEINKEFFLNAAAQVEVGVLKTIDRAQILLHADANINIKNKLGTTPLHNAVNNGSLNLVKFLIKNGAHVTQSVLNCAIFSEKNTLKIVKMLLEAGIDLRLKNSYEATPKEYQLNLSPLDHAEVRGKDDIAELIKEEMRKQGLLQ